jgi:hypothetical protein
MKSAVRLLAAEPSAKYFELRYPAHLFVSTGGVASSIVRMMSDDSSPAIYETIGPLRRTAAAGASEGCHGVRNSGLHGSCMRNNKHCPTPCALLGDSDGMDTFYPKVCWGFCAASLFSAARHRLPVASRQRRNGARAW